MINKKKNLKLAIIGLGYVGLPLALEFGKKKITIGYDIDKKRVKSLISGIDKNLEFDKNKLSSSKFLSYTNDIKDIKSSNFIVFKISLFK